MRLKAYYDIDSGTDYYDSTDRSSMFPADTSPGTYDVKILRVSDGAVYWATKVALTIAADQSNDVVIADWTTSGQTIIPLGESIEIHVSGMTNPPTTTELN